MIEIELERGTVRIFDGDMQCEICGEDLSDPLQAQKHIADHRWQDKLAELKEEVGTFDSGFPKFQCRVCGREMSNTDMNLHVQDGHYDSQTFSVLAFGTPEFYEIFRE
jgi:hypothetical protein